MELQQEIDAIMSVWRSVGADLGTMLYLSVPITSGRREQRLLRRLGCSRDELKSRFGRARFELVIQPNNQAAELMADRLRWLFAAWVVINPAVLNNPDWKNDDYMALWLQTVEGYTVMTAVTPGWAFSAGSRQEVALSLKLGIPIVDLYGRMLMVEELQLADLRAHQTLRSEGFREAMIVELLPALDFTPQPFVSLNRRRPAVPHRVYIPER